jgi:predicted nucleic-acid-binding protein
MIALDTNVLVRYLTQDDTVQAPLAEELIDNRLTAERPGFVSVTALLELDWALRRIYRFPGDRVAAALIALTEQPNLVFEHADLVEAALASQIGDLADNILHLTSASNGCTHTLTFDKKFARLDGVELLK